MWAREEDAVKLSREVKGIVLKIEIKDDESPLRRQIRTN